MRVEIRGIIDSGILDSERIVLDVLEDCNLGHYILFDTSYTHHDKPSNDIQHTYKFPTQQARMGDVIVLYSKDGKNSIHEVKSEIVYSFYWNLNDCVWQNNDCALIAHFDSFTHKKVNDTTRLNPKKFSLGMKWFK